MPGAGTERRGHRAGHTSLERKRVLRALPRVRPAGLREVPPIFRGTVEVDETDLGGWGNNRRLSQRRAGTKRGRGTRKTPVFGILCRGGRVWAQGVPDVAARTLLPLIRRRVRPGSVICSDTWTRDTGIAAQGSVHRLVAQGQGEFSDRRGSHSNGLEGCRGDLKRRLAAKGGIRRERLPWYVAEDVWRYHHRRLPIEQQVVQLMNLIAHREHPGG